MSTQAPPQKTVVEIYPETHQRLRDSAKASAQSIKRFTTLLLEFGLSKLESGEIQLNEPTIQEVTQQEGGAK